ncbi:MAG: alanine:cation symporter family protein [Hyphomicrobiales bacterium]|nr:alanine:cation symporter family protein [Hyphomicrobiales bacterium]
MIGPVLKPQPFTEKVASILISGAESFFSAVVEWLAGILFYPIMGFPFLVLWLLIGGVFFTLWLGFINIRLFRHAVAVVQGKFSSETDPGQISHFQALAAAVSATVGLGNIAGVAVAVGMGGPGAVIWMVIGGFFGMSTKFAEVTLGQKYRKIDENGKVSGGAFHYLREGLSEIGFPRLGKVLGVVFAIFCIGGSLGGGNMFQANQAVASLKGTFPALTDIDRLIAFAIAVSVGIVLLGGIRRIANVAQTIVPLMAVLYLGGGVIILAVNASMIPEAVSFMFRDAFTGEAVGGGLVGALVAGIRRAAFSNEAGLGSAPIAHAAARTAEPVREGCVALLEPFIDTVVICFMTGLIITVTGAYKDPELEGGVMMTSAAFATVSDWFPIVLSIAIVLFAYSTMITWSYYGERAWAYLFSRRTVGIYHIIFITATFFGGIINFGIVLDFSDLLILGMAIPNLVGLYMLSGMIQHELKAYMEKLKGGKFAEKLAL